MTCSVGPVSAIVIDVIHPGVRATGASVLALFQNLFGLAAGPFIVGMLSDSLGLASAMTVIPVFGALAAVFFLFASRSYEGDKQRVATVLHLGHDRQSEGRAVQPPLDDPAHLSRRRCPTRSTARRATPSCRWCRCSTSTPGACRTSPAWSAPSWCFPGPWLDGKSLHELFESEGVTLSAGVPTVWQGLLDACGSQRPEIQHHAPHRSSAARPARRR